MARCDCAASSFPRVYSRQLREQHRCCFAVAFLPHSASFDLVCLASLCAFSPLSSSRFLHCRLAGAGEGLPKAPGYPSGRNHSRVNCRRKRLPVRHFRGQSMEGPCECIFPRFVIHTCGQAKKQKKNMKRVGDRQARQPAHPPLTSPHPLRVSLRSPLFCVGPPLSFLRLHFCSLLRPRVPKRRERTKKSERNSEPEKTHKDD